MDVVVFDIDGVISDTRDRDHHIENHPKDWDEYYADAKNDAPIFSRIMMLEAMAFDYRIFFSTGRTENIREDTIEWLYHNIPLEIETNKKYQLLMRPNNDYRPNEELKYDHARKWKKEGYNLVLWVDDNPKVKEHFDAINRPTCPVFIVPSVRRISKETL